VFYIDGNDEHHDYLHTLGYSYADLVSRVNNIPNVVYLQDNVVVIDGVAILGTNGWWGFDFDLGIDYIGCQEWYREKFEISESAAQNVARLANTDSVYMSSSIKRLQTHKDVKKIVVVTHTVPDPVLISHDINLEGTWRLNTMGNQLMRQAHQVDTEKKIHTWCFGHYHSAVDQVRDNVQYINHCRGRGNTDYGQHVYYPRRITVNF
jgi:predicted phosphohydrolase